MLELTPVEFACETMANVEKELYELIAQYKADPNKNINPFSMRLQGIIDANVMGGISKYQEAFFTEQFARMADGNQQANVHKLKCLILDQVLILETALELHGQLAPVGVQPLHKRLLERFSQLKQSLAGMGKWTKRPHSDSIINTPLPPLPTEKRSISLENSHKIYEQDDIYTRPMENSDIQHQQQLNREGLLPLDIKKQQDLVYPAPPVPVRPKSACYGSMGINDGPEIPPKVTKSQQHQITKASPVTKISPMTKAPPLPPRGFTPDKRASNPLVFGDFESTTAPNIPRRGTKYSVVNISLDDGVEADHHMRHGSLGSVGSNEICGPPTDFCDLSDAISNDSSNDLNNLNSNNAASHNQMRTHLKNNSNTEILNIQAQEINEDDQRSFPPPIPPKASGGGSLPCPNGAGNDSITGMSPNGSNGGVEDGYCVPKDVTDSEHLEI